MSGLAAHGCDTRRDLARAYIAELDQSGKFPRKIVTRVEPPELYRD